MREFEDIHINPLGFREYDARWLYPKDINKEGIKNVLTICPGFSSDCVETLEEILIQGKESFISAGGENFDMVPCLNDNDDHILLLKSLIERNV